MSRKLDERFSELNGIPGVYTLYKDGKCIYVGKADCLQSRMTRHCAEKFSDCDSATFALFPKEYVNSTKREYDAIMRYIESIQICGKRPTANRQRPDPVDLLARCPLEFQREQVSKIPGIKSFKK